MSPMHQRTTRMNHTNTEEWDDIKKLIPGIEEYLEQVAFNITMFSKYHALIKKPIQII